MPIYDQNLLDPGDNDMHFQQSLELVILDAFGDIYGWEKGKQC